MDELNVIRTTKKKREVLPITQYFGEMDLNEKQTEERVMFAIRMRDLILVVFALVELGNTQKAIQTLSDGYREIAEQYHDTDFDFNKYINLFSREIVRNTSKHIDDEYYTSTDRAILIAENEANTTLNNVDLLRAKESGKTHKKWLTMQDMNVRPTHHEVDEQVIPIDEYFKVGVSLMRFPKDYQGINVTGEETVNCRCTIQYL